MIPVNTDYARSIYCMVFSALKEADDRQLKKKGVKKDEV
jgi:hypothetical protein